MKQARLRKIIKALRDNPSIMCSSFFREGYSRALIAVEQEAEYQAGKEMLSERRRRAKELMDLLPDGGIKDKMEDEVFGGLGMFEDAGI